MANLPETAEWVPGITQIETNEPVLGGPDGVDNRALIQLGNRTAYLKQEVDALGVTVGGITTAGLVPETRTISAAGLATGGGSLAANRTITVAKATPAEAAAGLRDDVALTPFTGAAEIAAQVGQRLIVSHTLAAGVAPPAAAAGSQTRPLNTVDINTIPGASLAANQIVLPVGVYDVDGFAVGGDGANLRHQARLDNITDGITEIAGSNAFVGGDGSDGSTESRVMGPLTVAGGPKTFQLIHWFQAARAKGMGYENGNASGTPGVFARLRFIRIG